MAIDPGQLRQQAEAEVQAGRLAQALALYEQFLADDPRDWNTLVKVADLRIQVSQNRGPQYPDGVLFRDGFLVQAIAVWKQLQKLNPAALEPHHRLAELYSQQGLMVEAKREYEFLLDAHEKAGKLSEACAALSKMVEIDPDDLVNRAKLAEFHIKAGNPARAMEVRFALAETLFEKGQLREALMELELCREIDPASDRVQAQLARLHFLLKTPEEHV